MAPVPVVQPPPAVVPEARRADDGLLKQFISLGAPTFLGKVDEDPMEFLSEMDKRFRLMDY